MSKQPSTSEKRHKTSVIKTKWCSNQHQFTVRHFISHRVTSQLFYVRFCHAVHHFTAHCVTPPYICSVQIVLLPLIQRRVRFSLLHVATVTQIPGKYHQKWPEKASFATLTYTLYCDHLSVMCSKCKGQFGRDWFVLGEVSSRESTSAILIPSESVMSVALPDCAFT